MNNFNFGANRLSSYQQPTPGTTPSENTWDIEDPSYPEQSQATSMVHTRNMIKVERHDAAETDYHDHEDAEMEDMLVPQAADSLRARGYETSSTGTLPSHENDHRLQRELSLPQRTISSEADDGIKAMGRDVAVITEAMERLRALGISHNYGVPELCALGEQSAGKSSVIGALAGIHLPSKTGTCTRVPVQIKTRDDPTEGATWACKIYLELAYSHSRYPLPDATGVRIGPWFENRTPEMIEFMSITDKQELNEAINAAQKAILNPQHNPAEYLPHIGERWRSELRLEEFSPNLVVLEVSEPGHQPLSFIDLPGIIQIHDTDGLVDVVSDLVKHFINRKNTLLLCAFPMNGEAQNSTAFRYVKEAKATDRCIGVLTKPDLLVPAAVHELWLPLLRGQKEGFKMGHGFYITKQPSSGQEISHVQARIDEDAFFANTPPWTTELREFIGRCGTKNLRDNLSKFLAIRYRVELPNIQSQMEERASELDERLNKLPKSLVGEVQPKVLRQLQRFSNGILQGLDARSSYCKEWRDLRRQFRDAVIEMKPAIRLKDQSDETSIPPQPTNAKATKTEVCVDLESADDGSEVIDVTPVKGNRKRQAGDLFDTPAHKIFASGNGNRKNGGMPRPIKSLPQRGYFINCKSRAIKFTLREIAKTITDNSISDLPGDPDPQAKVELCQRSVEIWNQPMEVVLQRVTKLMEALFEETLERCFADYFQTDLYREAKQKSKEFMESACTKLRETIKILYETEFHNAFTVNEELLEAYKRSALEAIKEKRREIRATAYQDRAECITGKFTYLRSQRLNALAKISDSDLGLDPFEKELDCAAYVQGYYKLASMRWVDNVCQAVQGLLFGGEITENITGFLERQLGVVGEGGAEHCRALVEKIDPQIKIERQKLEHEKKSLEEAFQCLNQLFQDLAIDDQKPIPSSAPYSVPRPVPEQRGPHRREPVSSHQASAVDVDDDHFEDKA